MPSQCAGSLGQKAHYDQDEMLRVDLAVGDNESTPFAKMKAHTEALHFPMCSTTCWPWPWTWRCASPHGHLHGHGHNHGGWWGLLRNRPNRVPHRTDRTDCDRLGPDLVWARLGSILQSAEIPHGDFCRTSGLRLVKLVSMSPARAHSLPPGLDSDKICTPKMKRIPKPK